MYLLWPFYSRQMESVRWADAYDFDDGPRASETEETLDNPLSQQRRDRMRAGVLRRDGHKCALTGRPEAGYWALYQWEHPEAEVPGPIWDTVGAAHIFKCPFIHCLPILTTTIRASLWLGLPWIFSAAMLSSRTSASGAWRSSTGRRTLYRLCVFASRSSTPSDSA